MTKHSESLVKLDRALRRSEEAVKKALRENSPVRIEVEPFKQRAGESERDGTTDDTQSTDQ